LSGAGAMTDDFCVTHGYEFMRCEKAWGAIPYCTACDDDRQKENDPESDDAEQACRDHNTVPA
jgi:hypothetical protein